MPQTPVETYSNNSSEIIKCFITNLHMLDWIHNSRESRDYRLIKLGFNIEWSENHQSCRNKKNGNKNSEPNYTYFADFTESSWATTRQIYHQT